MGSTRCIGRRKRDAPTSSRADRLAEIPKERLLITDRSPLDLDRATMASLADQVSALVVEHLATLREQPAQRSLSRADAARLIAAPPPEEAESLEDILGAFRERIVPYHAREPH